MSAPPSAQGSSFLAKLSEESYVTGLSFLFTGGVMRVREWTSPMSIVFPQPVARSCNSGRLWTIWFDKLIKVIEFDYIETTNSLQKAFILLKESLISVHFPERRIIIRQFYRHYCSYDLQLEHLKCLSHLSRLQVSRREWLPRAGDGTRVWCRAGAGAAELAINTAVLSASRKTSMKNTNPRLKWEQILHIECDESDQNGISHIRTYFN